MGKTKIKSAVTKGISKTPVVMQLEALECGAASLAMAAAYYGKWVTLGQEYHPEASEEKNVFGEFGSVNYFV